MQIIRDTSAINPEPSVATIGFFDGVHAGHRYLIQQVKEIAAAKGLRSALVTFPVHPRKVMNTNYRPELLTTPEEKIEGEEQPSGLSPRFILFPSEGRKIFLRTDEVPL